MSLLSFGDVLFLVAAVVVVVLACVASFVAFVVWAKAGRGPSVSGRVRR